MFKWLQDQHRIALENEIKTVKSDLNYLNSQIEMIRTDMANLRGRFNQRLSKTSQKKEEEEESPSQNQDMNALIEELKKQGFT